MDIDDILEREDVPPDIKVLLLDLKIKMAGLDVSRKSTDPIPATESILNSIGGHVLEFIEKFPDPIYFNDVYGTFLYGNKAAENIMGCKREQLVGRRMTSVGVLPKENVVPVLKSLFLNACGLPTGPEEFRLITLDKKEVFLEICTFPLKVAGKCIVMGVARDITARRRAEEFLRDNEKRLEALFQMSPALMGLSSVEDGRYIKVNRRFEEVTGYSSGEAVGKSSIELGVLSDESRKLLKDAIVSSGFIRDLELPIATKDGSIRHCLFSGSVINYMGRQVLLVTANDLTERKQLEQKMREKERLSLMGEIAAGVAHDFNNNLQGIIGFLEVASGEQDLAERNKLFEDAFRLAKDSAERISQLQRFARRGVTHGETAAQSLNKLIDESIEQTRHRWEVDALRKGVKISIERDYAQLGSIDGNAGELKNAFDNLIKNSVESIIEKKKSRNLHSMNAAIRFSTEDRKDGVYAQISDTGTGIPEDMRRNLFTSFQSTKGYDLGRGLGMANVLRAVLDHEGKIYLKSADVGEGTTIELMLPYGTKTPSPERPANPAFSNRADKILWVEDELFLRVLAEKMAKGWGCTVDVVETAEEALKKLNENKYDVLLTDIGLPGMSGWHLAEIVNSEKKKGNFAGMRVIVLTGHDAEVMEEKDLKEKYGVAYTLSKPCEGPQIREAIDKSRENLLG